MNEQVKFIVDKLNREPFQKKLTFLNFDSLQGNNLLQLLNDVFAEIDPKQKIDIRNEEPDITAIRMLNFLRVLKYKAPDDNATSFRNGLVTGDKVVCYPVLKWCLEKIPELKKRAYLANYLVKINVPGEFLGDPAVVELYSQYDSLLEQFKETHKTYDSLTMSQHTTEDLRRDIENMENEKEQISKRLDRLKKKVERLNNTNSMLELSHSYRKETERERKIAQQKQELHSLNVQLEQKIDKLERTVKEQQNSFHDLNAESIIQKMEEENKVNSYMVKQKFPKELNIYKQKLKDYESILSKSSMTQNDLNEIKKKIEDVNVEVRQLIERRDLSRDTSDDKLTMFRKQAHIIASKKDALAETLNELRSEYSNYERQLKDKRKAKGLGDGDGEMLRGEDFKRYVNKLRSKGTTYKMKKQQITELQAEFATLKRTEEILRKKFEAVKGNLSAEEIQAIDKKNKGGTGEENISKKELKEKITKKKAELSPYVKELKALREIVDEISVEYEAKKSKYDQVNAGYESNRSALEQDVAALLNEYRMSEERYHKLNSQKLISLAFQKRAQDEIKLYTSKTASDKSFREQLNKRINELDTLSKNLKDKQKSIKDVSIDGTKQMKLWKDLLRQMELKRRLCMGLPVDEMSAYNNVPVDFQS